MQYTGVYPLYVGPGEYNIDPQIDPAVLTPIKNGNILMQPAQLVGVHSWVVVSKCRVTVGPPSAQAGSWKVVGNSGTIAIHALPFTNELMLLMSRPANYAGGGEASLFDTLTVCLLRHQPTRTHHHQHHTVCTCALKELRLLVQTGSNRLA